MENRYYQDLISRIDKAIEQGKYDHALELISEEYKMPYIPAEIEEKLQSFKDDINYYLNNVKVMSEDEILAGLKSDKQVQLKAVESMSRMNLRNYLAEIQEFFDSEPDILVQALLIDSLITQEISHGFMVHFGDEVFRINFRDEVQGIRSEAFNGISSLLEEFFIDNEPATYRLCMQLLVQECFIRTPFNIKEDEIEGFANKIALTVTDMLGLDAENYDIDRKMAENIDLKCLDVAF